MLEDKYAGCIAIGAVLLVMFIFCGTPMLSWYNAGVQVEVYRRSGVEMTQWEVFCGAKPPDRVIHNAK